MPRKPSARASSRASFPTTSSSPKRSGRPKKIASFSQPIVLMAKESVGRAFETGLAEGVRFERRLFQAMFATEDQKEGMAAFIEKRKPQFRNR